MFVTTVAEFEPPNVPPAPEAGAVKITLEPAGAFTCKNCPNAEPTCADWPSPDLIVNAVAVPI